MVHILSDRVVVSSWPWSSAGLSVTSVHGEAGLTTLTTPVQSSSICSHGLMHPMWTVKTISTPTEVRETLVASAGGHAGVHESGWWNYNL